MGFTGIYIPHQDEQNDYNMTLDRIKNIDISTNNIEQFIYLSDNNILYKDAYYRINRIHFFEERDLNNNSIEPNINYDISCNMVNFYDNSYIPVELKQNMYVGNSLDVSSCIFGVKYLLQIEVDVFNKFYDNDINNLLNIHINGYRLGSIHFYKKIDKKEQFGFLWNNNYSEIKDLIKDELDYLINEHELFRYLDISSTLTDV